MLFSLLFIFSLSQSAYTWGFGLQGRSPLRQSSTKLTLSTERGERGGAAVRARRARASAGSASRAALGKGEIGVNAMR